MATGEAYLSQRVTEAQIRAEVAEARLAAIARRPPWWDDDRIEYCELELARLRHLVERQQAELAVVRRQLAEARARTRQVSVRTLVRSLLAAVEDGSLAFRDYAISGLQAELKALLQVQDGRDGLFIGPVTGQGAEALSTIRLEVAPLTTAADARARLLAPAIDALLELQSALDGPLPDEVLADAAVAISVLGDATSLAGDPAGLALRLEALEAPLGRLSAAMAGLADAVRAMSEARAALARMPGAAEVDRLTAAALALVAAVRGARS